MTTFDEREQAFEKKFKHDQEVRFKTNARRNKLIGLWAAARMGLQGADADAYAAKVVEADLGTAGGAGARDKVLKDLTAKGISASSAEVEREMERLFAIAKDEVARRPG
jgi:hypothetical protein